MNPRRSITVIGAGIAGMVTACYLKRDGHDVTVIDPVAPGEGCSKGNAGHISPGSCLPLAMPGVLRKVPGWLADPLGPMRIRWHYLPRAAPWLMRFVGMATAEKVEVTANALRALHAPVFGAYEPLVQHAGVEDLIIRSGQLYVYETAQGLEGDRVGWDMRRARGVEIQELDADAIQQLEPALAPIYRCGVYLPEHGFCRNPGRLVQALAEQFIRDGGTILGRTVTGFEIGPDGPRQLHTDAGDVEASDIVIAAGAWSHKLTAKLGDRLPLESQRGYHLEFATPGVNPVNTVASPERSFVATPMETGLRFAGTVEFAGLSAPPDYRRARMLQALGQRMFPGLASDGTSEWMGHRPTLPDSLPVIDRSTRFPSVYYAFGHGHTGISGSPVTGRIIADLVAKRPPEIDISPFRVDRF